MSSLACEAACMASRRRALQHLEELVQLHAHALLGALDHFPEVPIFIRIANGQSVHIICRLDLEPLPCAASSDFVFQLCPY